MRRRKKNCRQFADYVPRIPEIILYIRRQREIPRRQLELTLIDKEDEPAWRIKGILRNLMKDPQVMYLVTDRAESFAEMEEEAMEMYGLPFLVLDKKELGKNLNQLYSPILLTIPL